jgi:hypothetical protein
MGLSGTHTQASGKTPQRVLSVPCSPCLIPLEVHKPGSSAGRCCSRTQTAGRSHQGAHRFSLRTHLGLLMKVLDHALLGKLPCLGLPRLRSAGQDNPRVFVELTDSTPWVGVRGSKPAMSTLLEQLQLQDWEGQVSEATWLHLRPDQPKPAARVCLKGCAGGSFMGVAERRKQSRFQAGVELCTDRNMTQPMLGSVGGQEGTATGSLGSLLLQASHTYI